jgi:hypothetical protein
MSKEETLLQAKIVFEKTIQSYIIFLEKVYMTDEHEPKEDPMYVENTSKRFRDKLNLVSKMSRKYGNLNLEVPIFIDRAGNC